MLSSRSTSHCYRIELREGKCKPHRARQSLDFYLNPQISCKFSSQYLKSLCIQIFSLHRSRLFIVKIFSQYFFCLSACQAISPAHEFSLNIAAKRKNLDKATFQYHFPSCALSSISEMPPWRDKKIERRYRYWDGRMQWKITNLFIARSQFDIFSFFSLSTATWEVMNGFDDDDDMIAVEKFTILLLYKRRGEVLRWNSWDFRNFSIKLRQNFIWMRKRLRDGWGAICARR